jgi:5-deoxy-glucuronate isomerase
MNGGSLLRTQTGTAGQLISITPADAGWSYIHFAAYRLKAGERLERVTGGLETALIILGGQGTVTAGTERFSSIGRRKDVWERQPPYAVLLPPGLGYTVEAETGLHLAVAAAPAPGGGAPRLITPADVMTEVRGEGQTQRYIQHLLPPSARAERLILVEVYTPAGNWSSFPPHKHDTEEPPAESRLEETYYYQINPPAGFAVQRVYTDDRCIDQTLAPGDGDLVLVPAGYHPVAATPGHDCYYLNVMAGPTRAWNFRVDPAYAHLMNWQKPAFTKEGGR